MSKQLNSNQFPEVYEGLGIKIPTLGCIMLNVEPIAVCEMVAEYTGDNLFTVDQGLYYSENPDYWWIRGAVAEKDAHMTVLYGLLEKGFDWKEYVDTVLDGWLPDSIEIDNISYFDSPYPNDQYYCVIGHVKVTDAITEGNNRLRLLPHIDTFPEYKPHVTLAYINKDDILLSEWVDALNEVLVGTQLKVSRLHYGTKKD